MDREFVSYEIALGLKNLGFNEPCIYHWEKGTDGNGWGLFTSNKWVTQEKLMGDYTDEDGNICGEFLAPLYHQAFRWFREKHGLDGHVRRGTKTMHEHLKKNGFSVADYEWVVMKTDGTSTHTRGMEDTHTEGEQTCLKRLIKMVKENG